MAEIYESSGAYFLVLSFLTLAAAGGSTALDRMIGSPTGGESLYLGASFFVVTVVLAFVVVDLVVALTFGFVLACVDFRLTVVALTFGFAGFGFVVATVEAATGFFFKLSARFLS
jgi:hypothetical protein